MSAPAPKQATKAQRPNAIEPSSLRPDRNDKVASDPEQIATLAYSYWEARGGQGGSPEEDWLRAERQFQTGG
jgi:Protein of unknown function (DUF2934)